MSLSAYTAGFTFEQLLKKVYSPSEARTYQSYLRNIVSLEQGENHSNCLGTRDKQFQEVKELLEKTIIKLTKTTPYDEDSVYFDSYLLVIPICKSIACLMQVIEGAFERANRIDFKEEI